MHVSGNKPVLKENSHIPFQAVIFSCRELKPKQTYYTSLKYTVWVPKR